MKRLVLSISYIFLVILISSCEVPNGKNGSVRITSDSGNSYTMYEIEPDSGSADFGGLDVYTATADDLLTAAMTDSKEKVTIPSNVKEAAEIGSSILDETYDNWSEAGTVCVFFNDKANAWIVHGQMKDRYSTTGCGVVAIKADTGKILYMAYGD